MNRPKNKLFIIFSLTSGGTQRMMVNVLNELSTEDNKTVLYLYNYFPNPGLENQLNPNVEIYKCKNHSILKHLFRLVLLIKIIRKENFSKIISFAKQGAYLGIYSKIFFPFRRIPIIYRMVSVDEEINNSGFLLIKEIKQFLYINILSRFVSNIISQSNHMAESFIKKNPKILNEKVVTINNILPVNDIIAKSKKAVDIDFDFFIFVGRLSEEKNIPKIIDAYNKISDTISQKLVLIGDGAMKKEIEMLIIDFGLTERVIMLGYQENPYKYISRAKALILFSRYEGMPNVVLESMICKTPVVVSDFKGVEDIVEDDITGFVVAKNNVNELAMTIQKMVDNVQHRKQIVENAFQYISNFNRISTDKYTKLLT